MRKIFFILFFIFILGLRIQAEEIKKYKVIKIIDGDTVYIDFNQNNIADNDERIRINGIDAFETKIYHGSDYQMRKYDFSLQEVLSLGYLGTEYAKKKLLNKYVQAYYSSEEKTDKYNRKLMSIRYGNKKDYATEILKAGLAKVYTPSNLSLELKQFENIEKIKQNAIKTRKLKIVLLDSNNKYHNIAYECGQKYRQKELCQITKRSKNIECAKCCKINNSRMMKKYINSEN